MPVLKSELQMLRALEIQTNNVSSVNRTTMPDRQTINEAS